MPDLGTDFAWNGDGDVDAMMTEVSGYKCLQQALMRRLVTARGIFYDDNYGTDMKRFMSAAANLRVIEQSAENELLKEERVSAVTTAASLTQAAVTQPATISLLITATVLNGAEYQFLIPDLGALLGSKLLEQP